MTLLDEIRAHDASYGDHIPDHYQAQKDRRYLLEVIDKIKENSVHDEACNYYQAWSLPAPCDCWMSEI